MSDFIESDENDFELQKDLTKENQQNLEGATSETQYDKGNLTLWWGGWLWF